MAEDTDSTIRPKIVSKVSYKGVSAVVLEEVYEPAEDTFLLADCAVAVLSELSAAASADSNAVSNESPNVDFSLCSLEIGAGSGFVSAFIMHHFPNLNAMAVDINPNAVLCSQINGVRIFESDMFQIFDSFSDSVSDLVSASDSVSVSAPFSMDSAVDFQIPSGGFDFLVFNPPYLPTAEDEKIDGMLNYAFDGGVSGRDSIDRFLAEAGGYLTTDGFFLLLISSITGVDEVIDEMEKNGFTAEIVGRTKCSFEELIVLKGVRGKPL